MSYSKVSYRGKFKYDAVISTPVCSSNTNKIKKYIEHNKHPIINNRNIFSAKNMRFKDDSSIEVDATDTDIIFPLELAIKKIVAPFYHHFISSQIQKTKKCFYLK